MKIRDKQLKETIDRYYKGGLRGKDKMKKRFIMAALRRIARKERMNQIKGTGTQMQTRKIRRFS